MEHLENFLLRLVVEGVSDLLYIQTLTGVLQAKGRVGLDSRWTITPVGGSDKVPTFVALTLLFLRAP